MTSNLDDVFSSWPAQPWLAAILALAATVYARGWFSLRRRDSRRWNALQPAAFLSGLFTIYLALASPIEAFAPLLLQVHMLQHLLLMMVAPPLLWLAAPMFPLLRGLPSEVRRYWIAPLFHWRPLRWIASALTHPAAALMIFVTITWLWHLPSTYNTALADDTLHKLQHICFLTAGLLFWYPVVRPYPARPRWSPWWLVPFLLLADVQNTLLSAWLTFSDSVLYAHYSAMPRLGGLTALDDQAAAGVLMWVPGSVAFLLPLVWIGVRLVQGSGFRVLGSVQKAANGIGGRASQESESPARLPTRSLAPAAIPHSPFRIPHFDLLRLPIVGPILRSNWTRRVVQFAVLLVVIAVVIDGLGGPQIGPMNLAGVVPWIHWRWLVAIGLLVAGNVFCYGCPFMLPRSIARYCMGSSVQRAWPKWLRTKWLAVGLLVVFLWSYEVFSLWNRPWLTAWIAISYFVGALVIDSVFRDAAFCKFVCPIGQFHFVQSVISPLEVRVRQPSVCTSCRSHDCIQGRSVVSLSLRERAGVRGREVRPSTPSPCPLPGGEGSSTRSPPIVLQGCELQLFLPRKQSNLDCTFCLDCVRACPEDNVGLIATIPTATLWRDGARSGLGRLSHRTDYSALALVLVFGAFANAAGMARPIVDLQESLARAMEFSSTFIAATVFYFLSLLVFPFLAIFAAASMSDRYSSANRSVSELACRFSWSLVPLGFSMWLAHYSYHFFTSFDTIIPVTQRFVAGFGYDGLGSPNWICSCCRPAPDWLLTCELLLLDIGLLTSLYSAWRIAWAELGATSANGWSAIKLAIPWTVLAIILFAIGVWILLQPMEMRGTLTGG